MSLKEKILIADDSEMNQMLLEEILSDKYEYVMAKDGTEAVDILEKNDDIDLVMLDINMPKMDGFGVLEIMNLRHWINGGAGYHHLVRKRCGFHPPQL